MQYLRYKDIKTRYGFYKQEIEKNALKSFFIKMANNKSVSKKNIKKLRLFVSQKMSTRYSKTKIQRRCLITNRGKVSSRVFRVSRIKLREMLKYSIIPGYKKAVW